MVFRPASAYRSTTFDLAELARKAGDAISDAQMYARAHLPLIGKGNDRDVFLLSSRKVLKVATRPRGEYQSANERRLSEEPDAQGLVARVLDEDPKRHRWLISELVRPLNSRREWALRMGVENEYHWDVLLEWAHRSSPDDPTSFGDAVDLLSAQEATVPTLVASYKANRWLRAMYRLVRDHELLPSDLGRPSQYGVTVDQRLVLLDYGFIKGAPAW